VNLFSLFQFQSIMTKAATKAEIPATILSAPIQDDKFVITLLAQAVQFVVVQAEQFPLNYVVHDVEHDVAVHVKQVELYCVEHDPHVELAFTKYPELHVEH